VTHPGDGQGGWGGQQGGWGQPQYPPTGGFPQQQSQYGGLGVFSGGPPEPPKRSRAPIIAAVVLLLLVVGGVSALLVIRGSEDQATTTTSTPKSPSTTPDDPGTSGKPPVTCEPHASGWSCLPVSALAVSYDAPKAWKPYDYSGPIDGLPDVKLIGIATYGDYDCGGKTYNRGNAGGAVVPKADPGATAKDIATKLSAQYYSSGKATPAVGEPKPVTIPGTPLTGVQVDSVVTTTGNDCLATKGAIKVAVFQGEKNMLVFMSNGDLEGGPSGAPAAVTDADLQAVIDSIKPLKQG
jgi:hypothetical protein